MEVPLQPVSLLLAERVRGSVPTFQRSYVRHRNPAPPPAPPSRSPAVALWTPAFCGACAAASDAYTGRSVRGYSRSSEADELAPRVRLALRSLSHSRGLRQSPALVRR